MPEIKIADLNGFLYKNFHSFEWAIEKGVHSPVALSSATWKFKNLTICIVCIRHAYCISFERKLNRQYKQSTFESFGAI